MLHNLDGVAVDQAWIAVKLGEMYRNTIVALRTEVSFVRYDQDVYPEINIPQDVIVHTMELQAQPIFTEIFLKLDPKGELTDKQTVFVRSLCDQIFPKEVSQAVFLRIRERFIYQFNLDNAIMIQLFRVVPVGNEVLNNNL